MKNVILSLGVALSLLAVPAMAADGNNGGSVDLSTLSSDQLDSLISILSGLPRQ